MIDGDEVGAGWSSWLGFVSSMFRDFEVNRARAFYSRTDNELEVLYCCHGKLDSPEFFVIGREKFFFFFFFFFLWSLRVILFKRWKRQFLTKGDRGWLDRYIGNFWTSFRDFTPSHFKIERSRRSFRIVSSTFKNHFIRVYFKIILTSFQGHSKSFEQFQNFIEEFQMLFQIFRITLGSFSIRFKIIPTLFKNRIKEFQMLFQIILSLHNHFVIPILKVVSRFSNSFSKSCRNIFQALLKVNIESFCISSATRTFDESLIFWAAIE